jgi:hypothetical protein
METEKRLLSDLEKQMDRLKDQGEKLESMMMTWLDLNNPFEMTEAGFCQLLEFVREIRLIGYKYYQLIGSSERNYGS